MFANVIDESSLHWPQTRENLIEQLLSTSFEFYPSEGKGLNLISSKTRTRCKVGDGCLIDRRPHWLFVLFSLLQGENRAGMCVAILLVAIFVATARRVSITRRARGSRSLKAETKSCLQAHKVSCNWIMVSVCNLFLNS